MTNSKIEKVNADIEKTKAKIAGYQLKLHDLYQKKTELENMEIVAMVRSEKISDGELAALLHSRRNSHSPQNGSLRDE